MKHYRAKRVSLDNVKKVQWADYYEDGTHFEHRLEYIPINKIEYVLWNEGRAEFYREHFTKGKAADPVILSKRGSKYEVSDGNHRTAISEEMGYTHVPAIVTHEIQGPPKGRPPKDLYEEMYGRELLWLLNSIRRDARIPLVFYRWDEITADGYSFEVQDERGEIDDWTETSCFVDIDGSNRKMTMGWDNRRLNYRGDKDGLAGAFSSFVKRR